MTSIEQHITLSEKVAALRDAAAYGDGNAVVAVETHFAWVFLVGEFAYKLKKPVRIERMDFRTLAARKLNCEEEVRLNRRLAPQIYLRTMPLACDEQGQLRVGGAGIVVEWLVKMRRLPTYALLDRAVASGTATAEALQSAAQLLAQFFSEQPAADVDEQRYLARLVEELCETCRELNSADLGLDAGLVAARCEAALAFVEAHHAALAQRARDGRIIEGHGDLRPEHIFLGDADRDLAACVIDCLEFDRELRLFDPLEELAFLWLECARLDAAWVGREFIRIYAEIAADPVDEQLLGFYRARRALTRAKIAAWHLRDPEVSEQSDWRELAHNYLRAAALGQSA